MSYYKRDYSQRRTAVQNSAVLPVLAVILLSLLFLFSVNREINYLSLRGAIIGLSLLGLMPIWIHRFRFDSFNILIFLFLLYSMLTFMWVPNRDNWFTAIIASFSSILLAFLLANSIKRTITLIKLLRITWAIGAVFGLVQIAIEASGIAKAENINFAIDTTLLIAMLPIGFVFILLKNDIIMKRMNIIAVIIILFSVLLSEGRGPFLGILCMAILFMVKFRSSKKFIKHSFLLLVGIFLIIFVLVSLFTMFIGELPLFSKIKSKSDLESNAGSGRLNLWETALRIFVDHPVQGVGPGNFAGYYYLYAYPLTRIHFLGIEMMDFQIRNVNRTHAHNITLNLLVEYGITGTIIFYALFIQSLLKARRTARFVKRDPLLFGLNQALVISLLSFWVMSQYSGMGSEKTPVLWILFAMIEILYRLRKTSVVQLHRQ